jgi:hypothetical protein
MMQDDSMKVSGHVVTVQMIILNYDYKGVMGRDSSVSITTLYGLDGPGIESRLG